MVGMKICNLKEVEFLLIMDLGWPLKGIHLLENIQPMALTTLSCIEIHLVLHQGEFIQMMAMVSVLRGMLLLLLPM